jgi:hypothetical protein
VSRHTGTPLRIPDALLPCSEDRAVELLRGYFDLDVFHAGGGFTGSMSRPFFS